METFGDGKMTEREPTQINPTQRKIRVSGYWNNPANIHTELQSLIEELGHFPTLQEFQDTGNTVLKAQISSRKHGGVNLWRERFGFTPLKKNNGYWNNPENVRREIERVRVQHGIEDFPTQKQLAELGETSLNVGITKTGGTHYWRKAFGAKSKERPKGYWNNPENIIQEVKNFMEQNNMTIVPSETQLREAGNGLPIAISRKFPGGMRGIREYFNEDQLSKPPNYWNEHTIEAEMGKIVAENSLTTFPSGSWFQKHNVQTLWGLIIEKYPGGRIGLAAKLGLEVKTFPKKTKRERKNNYWTSEIIEKEAQQIYSQREIFSYGELERIDRLDLKMAINRHYPGGIKVLKLKLGIVDSHKREIRSVEDAREDLSRLLEVENE